ncbi:hypothetical protein BDW74DRAFT_176205 [Aspergillus multicolor]|uniref:uncharacterized protein n=1 Tax=Aspergillus multicolor TaxID=41759 RepID=UPI003CCCC180
MNLRLDPETPVADLVRRVQRDCLDGVEHQRVSLRQQWHKLQLGRDGLFNTSLSFLPARGDNEHDGALSFQTMHISRPHEQDVAVVVSPSDDEMVISMDYLAPFMRPDMATRLAHCLRHTIESLAASPTLPTQNMAVITPGDMGKITAWNNGDIAAQPAEETTILNLFHHQSLAHPKASAICAWNGSLSYQELDDRSNRLARHLQTQYDIAEEIMVALCFDKSLWAVVAQLGVLKAGGVVVPVNPKHPEQRIKQQLLDMNARVLLTTPEYADRFKDVVEVLCVGPALLTGLDNKMSDGLQRSTTPKSAAFVIFTSGSTGKPKGVVLTHAGLCACFAGYHRCFGQDHRTRCLQFAAYTFDASISDIWGTLCNGGCLCVISESDRMGNFLYAVKRYQANFAQLPPMMTELLDLASLPTLKTLVPGGEALTESVSDRLLSSRGDAKSWTPTGLPSAQLLPLQGHLSQMQPSPPTTSVGLTVRSGKGTWCKKILSTGDLGRYTDDGEIICMGRKDTQVKIRGQRAEIGEMEHHVKQQLNIARTALVTLVQPNCQRRDPLLAVVAEIEPSTAASNSENMLKPMGPDLCDFFMRLYHSLSDALPAYMVPTLFVPVARLPRTDSSKVDRRAITSLLAVLPETELRQYILSSAAHVAPVTGTEKQLQELWARVLGLDLSQIGAQDHFLFLGVATIFQRPVLRDVAVACGAPATTYGQLKDMHPFALWKEGCGAADDRAVQLRELPRQCQVSPDQIEDIYTCTPLQEGLMAVTAQYPDAYTGRWVYRVHDTIEIPRLKQAWRSLAQHLPVLRTRIVPGKAFGALQVVVPDAQATFSYGSPLVRFGIVDSGSADRYMVFTMHHSVYDGVSVRRYLDLLAEMYRGTKSLSTSQPNLTFDFALDDIIGTLLLGDCVCVPSDEERLSNLAGAINRMKVNKLGVTPRVLQLLDPADVPGVHTVSLSGEAVAPEHIKRWVGRQARIFNAYGITETTILTTMHEVTDAEEASNIRHAIAGTLWVVDEDDPHHLLPIGAAGKLLVGGPLLAQG